MHKERLGIFLWIAGGLFLLIFLLPLWFYLFNGYLLLGNLTLPQRDHPIKFLIPNGYIGWAYIDFNARQSPIMPMEGNYYIITLPASARLRTSTKLDEGWEWPWNKDEYYYCQDNARTRLKDTDYFPDKSSKRLRGLFSDDGGMIWGASTVMKLHRYGHPELIKSFFVGTEEQYYKFLTADDPVPDFKDIFQYPRNIDINPNKKNSYIALGLGAEALGPSHYEQAIDYYTNAITRDGASENALSYRLRARVYNKCGQYQKALDDCIKAINQEAECPENFYYEATAYKGLGQYQKAIDDCTKAINIDTKQAPREFEQFCFYKCRAESYMGLGNYQNAIDDYTEAISSIPPGWLFAPQLYNERAHCYEKLGKKDLAQQDREKAAK